MVTGRVYLDVASRMQFLTHFQDFYRFPNLSLAFGAVHTPCSHFWDFPFYSRVALLNAIMCKLSRSQLLSLKWRFDFFFVKSKIGAVRKR